ncbi:TIGR03826 family flagellar region protein [Virgibacillus sp. W0181]|uniref:TIGR03826 family flagellar region protein n=1 Tax=Virgibacillus sp. W0181 TaxID=3391581 RepID=UPI003F45F6EE
MAELDNCSCCGAVFAKSIRDICHTCYQKEEEAFNIVYGFLSKQKNREATIHEIVETTGVEKDLIMKFIKEGRLRNSQFPNLAYPCEKCSAPISEGRLCQECSGSLLNELYLQEKLEAQTKERKQRKEEKSTIYYAIDKHKTKKG